MGPERPAADLTDHVYRPTADGPRRLSRHAAGGRRNRHEPNASAEPTSGRLQDPCPFKLISARMDTPNDYLGIRPVTLYRYVGPQGELREQGQKVPAS